MQERAGPEWDHIDQPTLEEVEKSWAHSRCREVEFDISGGSSLVSVSLSVTSATPHKTTNIFYLSWSTTSSTLYEEALWMQP